MMKPWATMVAITVVYDDGHTRVAKVYPSEDALDDKEMLADLHEVVESCAGTYHRVVEKGGRDRYGKYARLNHAPLAVVVSMVEGALFGGEAPTSRFDQQFERVNHKGSASTLRVFNVADYFLVEKLESFLYALQEMGPDPELRAAG